MITLWYKRKGNNPANVIGYFDPTTRDIVTVNGNFSTMGTRAHVRRLLAVVNGEESGDYTSYE